MIEIAYTPPITDAQRDVLFFRADGLPKSEVLLELGISDGGYEGRMDNVGRLSGASTLVEKVTDAIAAGDLSLAKLMQRFDYARMDRLTALQREVYFALTDPENYSLSSAEVAKEMNRTSTAVDRLKRRVYYHLGLTDRVHAVVHRLGYDLQNPVE